MNEEQLTQKLTWVKEASREELAKEWEHFFGTTPPTRCGMNILRGNVSYQFQSQFHGALSYATKEKLRNLYNQFKKDPKYQPTGKTTLLRAGTKLIREYKGQVYEVTALEKGYSFQGKKYRSLSQIANKITGSKWNGKLFFGIK